MASQPTNAAINLISGEFWGRNPHDELTWLRANAPIYFDETCDVWGIATHGPLKEASKMPDVFSNAGGIRPDSPAMPMMIDMDDPEHWKRRKLVNRGFTPKRVRAQRGLPAGRVRRDPRRGVRAGRVRFRLGHRREAPPHRHR